jgi:hypothetical protein
MAQISARKRSQSLEELCVDLQAKWARKVTSPIAMHETRGFKIQQKGQNRWTLPTRGLSNIAAVVNLPIAMPKVPSYAICCLISLFLSHFEIFFNFFNF